MSTTVNLDLDMRIKTEEELELELNALALPVEQAAQSARESAGEAQTAASAANQAAQNANASAGNADAATAKLEGAMADVQAGLETLTAAVEGANTAAASANTSAQTAQDAAQTAQTAADAADTAAKTANEAAASANSAAQSIAQKADSVQDTSPRAAYHALYAQEGNLDVTFYGKTTDGQGIGGATVLIAGKNLLDPAVFPSSVSTTVNGVTFTHDGSGGFTVSGTATATATVSMFNNSNDLPRWCSSGSATYYFAANSTDSKVKANVLLVDLDNNYITVINGASGKFTVTNDIKGIMIRLRVESGSTVSAEAHPCISVTPDTSYEAYDGVTRWLYHGSHALYDGLPLYGDDDLGIWDTITSDGVMTRRWTKDDSGAIVLLDEPIVTTGGGLAYTTSDGRKPVTVAGRGHTEVVYQHDTKHYIDQKIAALSAAMIGG